MAVEPTDLYAVLGLTPEATQDQIRHAYRSLVRRNHPDTRGPGEPTQSAANDTALQRVIAAYAVLGDPSCRVDYDNRTQKPDRTPTAGPRSMRTPSNAQQPPIRVGPVRWHSGPT